LFELVFVAMTDTLHISAADAETVLAEDFQRSGEKGKPTFLQKTDNESDKIRVANKRQRQLLL
jgi:hypothetical protein